MLDTTSSESEPPENWEEVLVHWNEVIVPQCIKRVNTDTLCLLFLNKDGLIEDTVLTNERKYVDICLGIIVNVAMNCEHCFQEFYQDFLTKLFEPFMKRHE